MRDPQKPAAPPPVPPPPPIHPPPPPNGRGLGWFFAISGSIVLLLTVGCIVAVTADDHSGDAFGIAVLCGSPTLVLGGVFLWLGSRRLKR